ncbi:MAG TPA: hypothetical protein VNO20_10600 [Solirubrobacterales bacterium]|nr:hypothetical protein [Solirubrobacterales bacterium]
MRSAKHGIKVLTLAVLAVIGVMAVGAVGAQGQLPGGSTLGEFLVNLGTPIKNAATGVQLEIGYLLVEARDLKIECETLKVDFGAITNLTDGTTEVRFLGCVVNNHEGNPITGCEFKELGTVKAAALVLPKVHNGERFLLFKPLEGVTNLAVVSFKGGQGCILPLNNPVTGSVVAKVTGNELNATTQPILFNETNQLLSGDVLKYGSLANTAYLDGTGHVKLSDPESKLGIH